MPAYLLVLNLSLHLTRHTKYLAQDLIPDRAQAPHPIALSTSWRT